MLGTPPVWSWLPRRPPIGEHGNDFAVQVGTPIFSPISGRFSPERNGKLAWGNRGIVHGPGLSFAVGHLTSFTKSPGQKVKAGDLIGYSGGASSDPNSGVSTGPHVEVQFFNAAGQDMDPQKLPGGLSSLEQVIFGAATPVGMSPA